MPPIPTMLTEILAPCEKASQAGVAKARAANKFDLSRTKDPNAPSLNRQKFSAAEVQP